MAIALASNSNIENIEKFITEVLKEVRYLNNYWKIFICLNGADSKNKMSELNIKFKKERIEFIYRHECGKNDAINYLVDYIKSFNFDIIHFFDDDIILASGSISKNIQALINNENKPVLVGSNFYGLRNMKLRGVRRLFQYIFSAPYDISSDKNFFIAGCSYCTWLKYYPKLPSSNTEVAEDSFISIYFADIGDGLNSIIKPQGSEVYFELPESYREWLWQQVRTYIGIEKSFRLFNEKYDYYQNLFSWRYAENPRYRRKYTNLNLKESIRVIMFRTLQKRVYLTGNKMINNCEKVEWNKYKNR